ncbi:DUF4034 domain-containing protein [Burkholderia sp. F1]|uniref:DUF4034 domain-containing protein n=1 Tax=Burkholderia sp. F1 TaxID=3366817 RepID=UPI003D73AEB9
MNADTDISSVSHDLIPPAPSKWSLFDIDALLRAGDYAALDAKLDAALAASLTSREEEARYADALPGDLRACTAAGAEGLARLRAWQAANPRSAHAWLCEAHYWHHWAYEYRGSGWAESVTEASWACAHACATRTAVTALRALLLSPTMWSAPALIFQSVASFGEPGWLTRLVKQRQWPVTELRDDLPLADVAARDALLGVLARSGLNPDESVACPAEFPDALPGPVQGRKMRSDKWYWMDATLHLHPQLFFVLRKFIWYMQPRWGGTHEQILAFIGSNACAHLSDVEQDRLRHEIWRDEYLNDTADEDDDPDDVRHWMAETRARADAALHPYHRWEALHWLAVSHFMRSEYEPAYACLLEAEWHHPIDNNRAMAMAVNLTLGQDPDGNWLTRAIERASDARHCTAALILRGYGHRHGTFGFALDEARGEAWLDTARAHEPGSLAWNQMGSALSFKRRRCADAFAITELGLAAGGDSCAYLLGSFYEDGIHVEPDLYRAAHYYRLTMEEGGNMGAYMLADACYRLAMASQDPDERKRLRIEAIEAARKAHEMGHTDGLRDMLIYIGVLEDIPSRHGYMDELRRYADGGHPAAMAALSAILCDGRDKTLYNYRESVRWIMGAQAIAPDDEYVHNITRIYHEDGMLGKLLYKLHRKQIKAHEIPGSDNAMV